MMVPLGMLMPRVMGIFLFFPIWETISWML
jgi:hypothetical protein